MQGILDFLQNQQFAILAAMLVGLLYKFVPAFKKLSNELIPILAALAAWLTNVFGPTPAHASVFGDALRGFGGVFLPLADAAVSKLIHELFLRGAASAVGLKKP